MWYTESVWFKGSYRSDRRLSFPSKPQPLIECASMLCTLLLLEAEMELSLKPSERFTARGKDIPFGSARHDVASVGCVTQVEGIKKRFRDSKSSHQEFTCRSVSH